ncbi:MAG: hypothetical protein KBD78_00910 [Oligoflexales bacterium]|nr:hypothetical protein [Oligoflexales bacterium]
MRLAVTLTISVDCFAETASQNDQNSKSDTFEINNEAIEVDQENSTATTDDKVELAYTRYYKKLFDPNSRYYNNGWNENILALTEIDGFNADLYRYSYRYHFPLWQSITLALGPDLSYMTIEETSDAYLDMESGTAKTFEANIQYLALAVAARLQAGLDWRILTFAPYLEFGTDLFARSQIKIENYDEYEVGELEDGGKNRRLTFGSTLFFNFTKISIGLGADFTRISGDFGSSVKSNSIYLSIRGGAK